MRAKRGNNRNETTYGTNEFPLKPFAHVYPCQYNTITNKWEVMPKTAFEAQILRKQLATDSLERYTILNYEKLLDLNSVMWCIDFGEIKRQNTTLVQQDPRPLYKLGVYHGSGHSGEASTYKYTLSQADMFAMSIQRFYTRYDNAILNKTYYDKLISNNQFTENLFLTMKGSIGMKSASNNKDENRTLSYEQYSNCKRDTDTMSDVPSSIFKEPKPRADRCLSAYNPTTKELVVQFLPKTC